MFETVKDTLTQLMRIKPENIHENSHLRDDLNLDSLMILELVLELESVLDVEIDDSEVATFFTISDVVKTLELK